MYDIMKVVNSNPETRIRMARTTCRAPFIVSVGSLRNKNRAEWLRRRRKLILFLFPFIKLLRNRLKILIFKGIGRRDVTCGRRADTALDPPKTLRQPHSFITWYNNKFPFYRPTTTEKRNIRNNLYHFKILEVILKRLDSDII